MDTGEFGGQGTSQLMFDAFINIVERLEKVVELETAMLRQHRPVALAEFNHKKTQGMLELRRAIQALDRLALEREMQEPLERLRSKLDKNLAVLQMHLNAVGHVAAIIAQAIQDYDSDGTYSAFAKGGAGSR
jgi:hypothetical protein